jgi:glutamate/tyrosine decarboxylase-like PLP-dependent enzyme
MKIYDDRLLDFAHRHAVEFLSALPERHVGARATRDELLAALSLPLSEGGEEPQAVLEALASQAERGAVGSAGPRYFGFVIGGSLPVTVGADWMTTTWDQNPGIFVTSPLSSVAEEVASRWILELLHLPQEGSVGFVTGCQMANYTCLAAARNAVLRKAGWNVEEDGLPGAPRVNVVVSAEAHVTIHTSLRMLGFGTRSMIEVPTDEQGRMIASELARVVENLSGPTIICAQAGNVNSGAFDPLRRIAEIARDREAWLHIDGAFGLWAAASADRRHLVDGAELADSWATDAHKWLNVPYDCGLAITRHPASHRAAMSVKAEYIEHTAGAERDPFEYTPEFSRRARGIPVYAALRTLGRRGVEQLVDRCCAHARRFAELLSGQPGVEVLNDVVLNQVLVRFGDDDATTREVITRVQRDGTCWLGGTTWHGIAAMRISVSNWATTEEDVTRSAAAILRQVGNSGSGLENQL